MADSIIPATHSTVVLTSRTELSIKEVPTPIPTSGQALITILAFPVHPNLKLVFSSPFYHTFPLYPGGGCVGRVEAVGDDALALKPGQLVYVDPAILGRDAPEEKIVHGLIQGFNPRQVQLSTKAWTQGTMSQKTLVPIENVVPVDEDHWVKIKGFPIEKIWMVNRFMLSYAGFEYAKLQPGDTVVVAFATGRLGNAAIELALALGAAHVVGLGRTQSKLDAWKSSLPPQYASRVSVVALTYDIPKDTKAIIAATPQQRGADIFFDLTPRQAADTASAHIGAGIGALKNKGRIVFMGYIPSDISFPYGQFVAKDLQLFGGFMYDMSVPKKVLRLVESGLLSVDHYETELMDGGLEVVENAMDRATDKKSTRYNLFIKPNL
ncbi:NAD(P)-binding protein [Clavulina sp. PMI_390]|nr:NAD(P)-binding protein [Clavulina sp. PMI_390]